MNKTMVEMMTFEQTSPNSLPAGYLMLLPPNYKHDTIAKKLTHTGFVRNNKTALDKMKSAGETLQPILSAYPEITDDEMMKLFSLLLTAQVLPSDILKFKESTGSDVSTLLQILESGIEQYGTQSPVLGYHFITHLNEVQEASIKMRDKPLDANEMLAWLKDGNTVEGYIANAEGLEGLVNAGIVPEPPNAWMDRTRTSRAVDSLGYKFGGGI